MRTLLPFMMKEVLHIVRDMRSLIASLALPIFMLLLFGYAISFDVTEVGVGILDEDRSEASRDLVASLTAALIVSISRAKPLLASRGT